MKNFLLTILSLIVCVGLNAQSTIQITTSGGSFPGEKWVSITTAVDGGGTQVWGQGDGTQCNGSGLLTAESISIAPGTYFVNCYDQYDDSWDGTLIDVTAYGASIGNNGGVTPDDGADTDGSFNCEGTPEELEASFEIIVPNPPACDIPSAITFSNLAETSTDVSWTAPTSGVPVSYDYEVVPDGNAQGVGVITSGNATTTSASLTGLSGATSYDFYIRTNCAAGTSVYGGPFDFGTLIAGDICSNAIDLDALTSPYNGTTTGSTASIAGTCIVNNGPDVIFSITVPDNFDLEIGQASNTFDSRHTLRHTGACPGDTEVTCTDDPDTGTNTYYNNTGASVTAYFQVGAFSTGNGTFVLEWTLIERCAISALADGGTSTMCDPTTNEYAQDVIVTYSGAPTTGTLDVTIDGITVNAAITSSPQTVTVAGLTADAADKDVTAAFSDDAACTLTSTAVFTAPAPCTVTCDITSITDAGTGVMNCVGSTFDYEVVVSFINPEAGNLVVTAGTGSGTIPVTALTTSPQTVLITAIPADGMTNDVTATFSTTGTCTETATGLITAPAACPPANDDLANAAPINCGDVVLGSTSAATLDEDDAPDAAPGGNENGADTDSPNVWYSWTGTGESVTLSTCSANTNFDTDIMIYTGTSGALTLVDEGYDECGAPDYHSETTFTSVSGTNYLISVEGFSSTNIGDFELTMTCSLVNDDCVDAMNINGGGVAGVPTGTAMAATTVGGSASANVPAPCAGGNADDDVWFTFTADADGGPATITITPDAAGFTPVCEVFSGTCPTAASTALVCETGTDGAVLLTEISGSAANETFYIRVYDAGVAFTGGGADERSAGGFTIGVAGAALPAELTSFTGTAMDKYNTLKWETATEQNTSEFAIERSLNGRNNWEVIGTERAAGNSDETITYSFDDMRPVSQAYYRLNTVDLDGSSQTSNIVSIKRDAAGFDVVLVAPNPTTSKTIVTFESSKDANVNAVVTDITGKVISTLTQDAISGLNNMTIDLTNTPAGVYFLTMNNGVNNITRRIVKN